MIKTLVDILQFYERNGLIHAETLYYNSLSIDIISSDYEVEDELVDYRREIARMSQKMWLNELSDIVLKNLATGEVEIVPLPIERVSSIVMAIDTPPTSAGNGQAHQITTDIFSENKKNAYSNDTGTSIQRTA